MNDLFSTVRSKAELKSYQMIGPEWGNELSYSTLLIVDDILKIVEKDRKAYCIYPEDNEIFRIFNTLPPDKVKCVILGQDPYHTGNANGYAFGCKYTTSPSLEQINHAIIDMNVPRNNEFTRERTLQYLVDQGVFLLNTILTVRWNLAMSHSNIGWHHLIDNVLYILNSGKSKAFLLWGKEAQKYGNKLNKKHLVLTEEHPAAASYRQERWECNHFGKVNKWLQDNDQTPIYW